MLLGGDCEYARKDAEVLGRMKAELSEMAGVLGGRKAASRKISLRAAILSEETMTVRFGMVRFSPAVAFCCSR